MAYNWTDPDLATSDRIRIVHVKELRDRTNEQRQKRGYTEKNWANDITDQYPDQVDKDIMNEIYEALNEMRADIQYCYGFYATKEVGYNVKR